MADPGNALGAVVIFDADSPRTFTGRALEAISGGELVMCSGGTAALSSGATGFATTDILVAVSDDNQRFNGIALNQAGSNTNVTVAQRGAYILKAGGSCLPGTVAETIGDSVAVQSLSSGVIPDGLHTNIMAAKPIGRIIVPDASGGFALVHLNA